MTFVDTGVWAAFFVRADPFHPRSVRWMRENQEALITSDYVLGEVLTLLKAMFSAPMAI